MRFYPISLSGEEQAAEFQMDIELHLDDVDAGNPREWSAEEELRFWNTRISSVDKAIRDIAGHKYEQEIFESIGVNASHDHEVLKMPSLPREAPSNAIRYAVYPADRAKRFVETIQFCAANGNLFSISPVQPNTLKTKRDMTPVATEVWQAATQLKQSGKSISYDELERKSGHSRDKISQSLKELEIHGKVEQVGKFWTVIQSYPSLEFQSD